MSGDFTVYCAACHRPLILRRRKAEHPVAGVDVLDVDREGIARARCLCGEIWARDRANAASVIR